MNTLKHLSLLLLLVAAVACTTSTPVPTPDPDPDENQDFAPSLLQLITKNWSIDSAFHAGSHDASSTGKTIQFFGNGTYNFDAGSLTGNWHFTMDSSKVIIDEGLSYQQDWTIQDLSEERFDVTFKSPFTGKNSQWIMH